MKTILAWLADVYQRYGYIAVLICLVVIVALIGVFCYVFGISPSDFSKFLGMY